MMNKKDLIILVVLIVLSAISVLNFKVYGQDFDAPVLSDLSILPSSTVDISNGPVTLTFTLTVSDVSGVDLTRIPTPDIYGGSPSMPSAVNATKWALISGDSNLGTYSSTIFLDPSIVPPDTEYAFETGTFQDINSHQANRLYFRNISVINDSDADFDAPVLSDLSILPSSTVDISNGPVTLTFTLTVSDVSGVDLTRIPTPDIYGGSPSMPSAVNATKWALISGDSNLGTYSSTIFLDPSIVPPDTEYAFETGTFQDINSHQANRLYFRNISVINDSDADFDAPVLSDLSILPSSTVDISNGPVTLTFTLTVSDVSGVDLTRIPTPDIYGGSPSMPSAVNATKWALISGDSNLGTYSSTIFLDPSIVPPDTEYAFETGTFQDINSHQANRLYFRNISVINNYGQIYLGSNGITVKCPTASSNATATINNKVYTVVDEPTLRNKITNDEDVSCVCTSQVSNMQGLFSNKNNFNQDISSWDTSNVTDMGSMFSIAYTFNQNISNWDTSNVTDMGGMFSEASAFNQPIGSWDTASVTDMSNMFTYASNFNQAIGNWDVSNVINLQEMFFQARDFNQNIGSWACTPNRLIITC